MRQHPRETTFAFFFAAVAASPALAQESPTVEFRSFVVSCPAAAEPVCTATTEIENTSGQRLDGELRLECVGSAGNDGVNERLGTYATLHLAGRETISLTFAFPGLRKNRMYQFSASVLASTGE